MNCGLAINLSCRFLKVWGCDAYVKKLQPDKLEPKSENNGLLDLDRVIHIFIILKPKDVKLIMIVQLICGTAV